MAKGSDSKVVATNAILAAFPGSFVYDKEIRLPFVENGEQIQLKCVLTCAKTNVEENGENAIPGEVVNSNNEINFETNSKEQVAMTDEEKQNIKNIMDALGL